MRIIRRRRTDGRFSSASQEDLMACIEPNGTLTRCGEQLLLAMWHPGTAEEIAKLCHAPLFRVRSAIREFIEAGLAEKRDDTHVITPKGIEKMEEREKEV
jgi:hypothetical protein